VADRECQSRGGGRRIVDRPASPDPALSGVIDLHRDAFVGR
jgi:hypothetical protein